MTLKSGVTAGVTVEVIFLGRDRVVATFEFVADVPTNALRDIVFTGSGCKAFLDALAEFKVRVMALPQEQRRLEGSPSFDRLVSSGHDHVAILIRELILKARGKFQSPYSEAELCHCRAVPTDVVDRAIVSGCHTVTSVARMTSAGTSCGTCKPDTERLIAYRLKSI